MSVLGIAITLFFKRKKKKENETNKQVTGSFVLTVMMTLPTILPA